MNARSAVVLAALAVAAPALAQKTVAIKDARVVTVSGPTLEKATVVIKDGLIADVGAGVAVPAGARVIDGAGLTVYPGLIDADSVIGLREVPGVTPSDDYSEIGEINPQLIAATAFNRDSAYVAIDRIAGVTTVVSSPTGGMLPGQASIMDLAGSSIAEMEVARRGALVIDYPKLLDFEPGAYQRTRRPYLDRRPAPARIKELSEFLVAARKYGQQRPTDRALTPLELKYEAVLPALEGKQTVYIPVDSDVDMRAAVQFAKEQKLARVALVGAADSYKIAPFLKQSGVSVVLGAVDHLPVREDDPIDIVCRTPAILHEAGVPFTIATRAPWTDARTLRHDVGVAVACGLPRDVALRSLSLTPAEILGVSDRLGSVEKGKRANLVVYDGDILDFGTRLTHLFIGGGAVPLESRHTQLFEQYKDRR
jgi:imidazolonepropionase-like amidohydrolase